MSDIDAGEDAFATLRARADSLERQLQEAEIRAAESIKQSELKSEAIRAGIVDLDGLKLLEPSTAVEGEVGEFNAADAIRRLRRDKPWLFAGGDSSSSARPPPLLPTKRRLATEMSVEEWQAARAALLRRR